MLRYLRNIIQLILSPAKGWEDISASLQRPDELLKHGFYPLLTIAALSTFVRLAYNSSLGSVIEKAIAIFGSYFISYFICILLLDHYLKPLVDGEVNQTKTGVITIYGLSLLAIIELIDNVLPTELTIVKFLPIFVALILYKGCNYMSVKADCEMQFLCLISAAVIVVPIGILYVLGLIID